ncbi:MAG: TolC family protein [Methylococcales bacterium]|nr:TolC family protein [Methylococcales bacterium]
MSSFRHIRMSAHLLIFSTTLCFAHENAVVDHHDMIHIDKTLTLAQVITHTVDKFPAYIINAALKDEANALQRRGDSWLAGVPSIAMRYQGDFVADNIGSREIEAELELPLWNWGQRSAGQAIAEHANTAAEKQSSVLTLEVAGLVRQALWNINLESLGYDQAQYILQISEKMLNKIKRRVDLGDLPRSDLLLAQSDHLQKRSLLIQAEAEMMHARKSYINLTQTTAIPADYTEQQSTLTEISQDHPKLSAINSIIQRKQAELKWVESTGSGQTSLIFGGKSERDELGSEPIESISLEISIPFGGSAHLAPEIALANIELTTALAERASIFRQLEKQHHEAKHALEVTHAELEIAHELKEIAESHLKMARLSFSAGEINLMDLLKIQARSHNTIRHSKEHGILLKKNIALYNQSVGVIP